MINKCRMMAGIAGGLALAALAVVASAAPTGEYIHPDAPTVKIKPYEGDRYEAMVPDTLDLAERARLAVNGLTEPLDPEDEYNLYWLVNFHNNPPIMQKEALMVARTALPLARQTDCSGERPRWTRHPAAAPTAG